MTTTSQRRITLEEFNNAQPGIHRIIDSIGRVWEIEKRITPNMGDLPWLVVRCGLGSPQVVQFDRTKGKICTQNRGTLTPVEAFDNHLARIETKPPKRINWRQSIR